jgi:hypothetical protein
LLRRLAALVPRPEKSAGPRPANATTPPLEATGVSQITEHNEASRIAWAELLLRVFRDDVLLSPCGGRRLVLVFITEKKVVKEILEHLGLPATGRPSRPRGCPRQEKDIRWQDDVPELEQSLR